MRAIYPHQQKKQILPLYKMTSNNTQLNKIIDTVLLRYNENQLLPGAKQQEYEKIYSQSSEKSPNLVTDLMQAIIKSKQKIKQILQKMRLNSSNIVLTEQSLLFVKKAMRLFLQLNNNLKILLQDGILFLCVNLYELINNSYLLDQEVFTKSEKSTLLEMLEILLKQYFIYKQCIKLSSQRQISIEFINQTRKTILEKSIKRLIIEEAYKEEKKLKEKTEVCRLCFLSYRFDQLERHLKFCSKNSELKVHLNQENQVINKLIQKIKHQYSLHNDQQSISRHQSFLKLIKLITKNQRGKQNVSERRASLQCENRDYQTISKYLQKFIMTYGYDEMITQLLSRLRQRQNIQKKQYNLQLNQIVTSKNISNNTKRVISSKKILTNAIKNHQSSPKFKGLGSLVLDFNDPLMSRDAAQIESVNKQPRQKQRSFYPSSKKSMVSINKLYIDDEVKSQQEIQIKQTKFHASLPEIFQSIGDFDENVSLECFDILKFLGKGAFGKVYLARRKQTNDIYALKIIKILQNYDEKEMTSIRNQHKIFQKISGDHLVQAPFSFSQQSSQIFILQYLPGGDLRKLLTEHVYFDEAVAKIYLAEIVLAIEHLHKYEIIHRDLKPQNLVIDMRGHLKLTDFGLSQFQINKKIEKSRQIKDQMKCSRQRKRRDARNGCDKSKMTLIGTPDYIAPEIINKISLNNYTIDWWSLGVMAYELIIGTRPFCATTIDEVIDNITRFNIQWPEVGYGDGMISPQAKDLIVKLLDKDFTKRLGSNGAEDIKNHQFFADVQWENLKQTKSPITPKIPNLQTYKDMKEDVALREQIQEFIRLTKRSKTEKLGKFIRFDLLQEETMQSMQKNQSKIEQKIQKLRSLVLIKDLKQQMQGME